MTSLSIVNEWKIAYHIARGRSLTSYEILVPALSGKLPPGLQSRKHAPPIVLARMRSMAKRLSTRAQGTGPIMNSAFDMFSRAYLRLASLEVLSGISTAWQSLCCGVAAVGEETKAEGW